MFLRSSLTLGVGDFYIMDEVLIQRPLVSLFVYYR